MNRYDLDGRFGGLHVSVGAKLAWHYGSRAYGGYLRWRNRQQARAVGVGMAYIGSRYLGYRYGIRVYSGGRGLHLRGAPRSVLRTSPRPVDMSRRP